MQVSITWADGAGKAGEKRIDVSDLADESSFWEAVAKNLADLPMPFKGEPDLEVRISTFGDSCKLAIKGRDEHIVDGKRVASPAIFPASGSEGGIHGLRSSTYPERYLTFCSEQSAGGRGSYKFYRFIPNTDGTIGAEYGRIGQGRGFGSPRRVKEPYPGWMYHIKVQEKLMKGYSDESQAYVGEKFQSENAGLAETQLEKLSASQRLFRLLAHAARGHAARELRFPGGVTVEQTRQSQKVLYEMSRRKTVDGFNRQLKRLLQIAPRNLQTVSAALASSESDFARIIGREERLVAAMRGVVASNKAKELDPSQEPSFKTLGVQVELADDAEKSEVLSRLSKRLQKKVSEIYTVDCSKQSRLFEKWVAERGIEDVRMFWHGSPASNWSSILENSLWVPAAADVKHGSMFGRGIYFGSIGAGGKESSDGGGEKSWGYVGAGDSYWERGANFSDVYMALFDVAYGKPLYAGQSNRNFTQDRFDDAGCDCVHAERGTCGLRNDETVVYDSRAVRIRYLVRFSV